jgi:hypothetical protein
MTSILHASQLSASRLRQALEYWNGKRAGRPMPARRDLDPVEIPALLPWLMLIDVITAPALDFSYRLIGTEVRRIAHANNTGQRFSALPGKGRGSVVFDNCEQVVTSRAPFSRSPPYVGPDPAVTRCENLLLPLSSDGTAVDMILQVVAFERAGAGTG